MSVRKFRTFDEAREAQWLPTGHPSLAERMKRLAALARPGRTPDRGVRRFRTIEEAKAWKRPHCSVEPA